MDNRRRCVEECLRCAAGCERAARAAAARAEDALLRALVSCAGVARVLASLIEERDHPSRGAARFLAEQCGRAAELCLSVRGDGELSGCAERCTAAAACVRAYAEGDL